MVDTTENTAETIMVQPKKLPEPAPYPGIVERVLPGRDA